MIGLKRQIMKRNKVVAYWNIFDSQTGSLLEKEKTIERRAMPSIGGLMIGVPGRLNAIVQSIKFSGTKDRLPRYDVYV
jgi:hypothetical protein